MDIPVKSTSVTNEQGGIWELQYFVREYEKYLEQKAYGLKITRHSALDNAGNTNDNVMNTISEETQVLTHSYEEAEEWAHKLAAGLVMPMSLHEIADDLVGN
jgi:hypothetical protein